MIPERNSTVGKLIYALAIGVFCTIPTQVWSQAITESLIKQLKPIKILDNSSCKVRVPDQFSLMQRSGKALLPPTGRKITRLTARDVLSEDEYQDYLAPRAMSPATDEELIGMVSFVESQTHHTGITYSINGELSVKPENSEFNIDPVQAKKLTKPSGKGNVRVVIYDAEGLAIDQKSFSLLQLVYLLRDKGVEERVVNVKLIYCASNVSWGFTVANRTFLISSTVVPFNWTVLIDKSASSIKISGRTISKLKHVRR